MASLHGARLVTAIETDRSGRFDETLLKWLTGGDTLSARRMREDFWEFDPTHKFWIAGNHRPRLSADDPAIWRRMNVIPFEVVIPDSERDKTLSEKLKAEAPGILRWAIEGCLAWQKSELDPPKEVQIATEDYRKTGDVTERFLEDCCIIQTAATVSTKELYSYYLSWCTDSGEHPLSQRKLGEALEQRGFQSHKGAGGTRERLGLKLISKKQDGGTSGASGSSSKPP